MTKAGNTTWLEVRAEIMRRIAERQYEAGALIPTEEALAEEFGCARATVNRALTSLAERGVVARRRRIGTRVAESMNRGPAHVQVPVLRHIVEARGQSFSFEYRGTSGATPSRQIRERLFLSKPDDLREHVTIFRADGELLCAERRWLDHSAVPALTEEILQQVSLNEWLAENAGLTQLERHLSARCAGEVNAERLLGCPADAPVLTYLSCVWVGPRPISCTRHVFVPGFGMDACSA